MKSRSLLPLRLILVAFILLAMGTVNSVLALSLDEAKGRGLVGEQLNGYLGIVELAQISVVQSLVNDINRQRRERYQEIASGNKTSLEAVESLAGKAAIRKTPDRCRCRGARF